MSSKKEKFGDFTHTEKVTFKKTKMKYAKDRYYDTSHSNIGLAVIFNQMKFKHQTQRYGSDKDAKDLEDVLEELGFKVVVCTDYTVDRIKTYLAEVSRIDHSDSDCLLIAMMTHGGSNGRIYAFDGEFLVEDLFSCFIGDNCKTLKGKPKLFFNQACRTDIEDQALLKKAPQPRMRDPNDATPFVIPTLSDLLIMHSTAERFPSFREQATGSWFIQALCDELKESSHEELMTILTGVNRRVAFAKQSDIPYDPELNAVKQMPYLVSMLTKTFYFRRRTSVRAMIQDVADVQVNKKPGEIFPSRPTDERHYDFSHRNTGIAVIFSQETFKQLKGDTRLGSDYEDPRRFGSDKDAKNLKDVLEGLGFKVEVCTDYSVAKIKAYLSKVSQRDHSDNDCLLITMMTHGYTDGTIFAYDGEFSVRELYNSFIGDNCKTLIGKPKLFFIQACRGEMTDPGTDGRIYANDGEFLVDGLYKYFGEKSDCWKGFTDPGVLLMPRKQSQKRHEGVDAETPFVIPSLCDLLIMYSTLEGFYSFRSPTVGSWFIQALCDELKENSQKELLTILTGVNRRVAFDKQSHIPRKPELHEKKQTPNIVSMLTKSLYLGKVGAPLIAKEEKKYTFLWFLRLLKLK